MSELDVQLQSSLGSAYTIERELGGGGMSRVFVADEQVLGRKVVIKVLKAELAEGLSAERFKREVRLSARLQHPHIVPLLAAGALPDGSLYYTMPYVDGESLRARLQREGPLPFEDVIRLSRDIASALAYAHRAAVVHRDIKPENILLCDGGAVVADFGIAKAITAAREPDADLEQRGPSTLTAAGISLGTPAYMAPEQVAGGVLDHRADLYALGVVLYEMIAGRPPFDGRSTHRLLAAHATEAPEPIARRRQQVPLALGTLVTRLLAKEPADRLQSADQVIHTLDALTLGALAPPASAGASQTRATRSAQRWSDPWSLSLVAILIGLSAALTWALRRQQSGSATDAGRTFLTLELPADARLNSTPFGNAMRFSPDGSVLVYVGGTPVGRLYQRRLDDPTPRVMPGTEGALNPRFSPDGRWIAFVAGLVLKRVPVQGGAVVPVAKGITTFAWGPDGTIVLSRPSVDGLWKLGTGGTLERVTNADSVLGGIHSSPEFLPDGKTVLFTSASKTGAPIIGAVRLGDQKATPVGVSGSNPLYLRGGFLVVAHPDGRVGAVRFDEQRLRTVGEEVPLLDHVSMKVLGSAELAVSPNGTLIYLPGPNGRDIAEVDRHGDARVLISSGHSNAQPRVSPDGRRIAVAIGEPPYSSDIWVYDLTSGTFSSLTTDGTNDRPEWTPDGRRLLWTSNSRRAVADGGMEQAGIWWQPWDASAPPAQLLSGYMGAKLLPRQDFLVAGRARGVGSETFLVRLPNDSHPTLLLEAASVFRQARPSHDGRWIAYVSDETGSQEIYVRPLRGPGGKTQISNAGGVEPVWGPGDRELFYRSGDLMMSATLSMGEIPTVIRRDTLFKTWTAFGLVEATYDVMPDGKHFVMLLPPIKTQSPNIVFRWADDVRARVAAAQRN